MGAPKMEEVGAKHPFPWAYQTGLAGQVHVFDARGVEVPLFVLLDFAVMVTAAAAQRQGV